jgi:hypothetical protein
VLQSFDAQGSEGRPPTALAAGRIFWRLAGDPVAWPLRVSARAPRAMRMGNVDWNGDGIVDVVLAEPGRACIRFGGSAGPHAACDAAIDVPGLEVGDPIAVIATGSIAVGAPATVTSVEKGEQFRGGAIAVLRAGHSKNVAAPEGAPARLGSSLAAVDRDGDGRLELLAVASTQSPRPTATVYEATSGEPRSVWTVRSNAVVFDAGDLDGDGRGDVVLVADRMYVWMGRGDPPGNALEGVTTDAVNVASGDLDGDGYDDLIVARLDHAPNRVVIYRGGPDGIAREASAEIVAPDPQLSGFGATLATADLDGDGRRALVVGCTGDREVRFFHLGERAPFGHWVVDADTLVAGDFDGDGRDEIVARGAGNELWWFRGAVAPVTLH